MNRTLMLAAAAVLIAAPAQAQMRTDTDAGKPWSTPHESTASGLPSASPQVESLQGAAPGDRVYSGSSSTYSRTTVGSGSAVDTTTSTPAGRVQIQSGVPYGRSNTVTRSQAQSAGPGAAGPGYGTGGYATGGAGSTGSTGMASGSGSAVGSDDILARRGRGQNDLELTQTSLLNEFSAQGYTAVRDFHKNGQNYVANVQDQQGRWMNVELDPRTRAITPVR